MDLTVYLLLSGYGQVTVVVLTFLIMLLPRARQKVAMGKEEMFDYTEAREEHSHTRHQVSSL